MTRLSRCYAWNTSHVTFLAIFPITWSIQTFHCNLQSIWMLWALLSATAAQERRLHMKCTLPDGVLCSNWRHLGSSRDSSSSWVPAPPTNQKKKEREKVKIMHAFTASLFANLLIIWDQDLKKKNRSSPFKNLGFKQVTNEQWMLNRIAMRALGCKLQGAVPMVVSINAAPGVIQPTGPLWLVCLGVSVT